VTTDPCKPPSAAEISEGLVKERADLVLLKDRCLADMERLDTWLRALRARRHMALERIDEIDRGLNRESAR